MKNFIWRDFLTWEQKLSRLESKEIISRNKDYIDWIVVSWDIWDWSDLFSPVSAIIYPDEKEEIEVFSNNLSCIWLEALNPKYKLSRIMWNENAKLIDSAKTDFWREYKNKPVSDKNNIPDWIKQDLEISNLINSWIWWLVYYINNSKETIERLKLQFGKWYIYFDWLRYIFKKFSSSKKVRDEVFEMSIEEFEEMWELEIKNFLKA